MDEQQKMYIWCRLAQVSGALAVVLGFLAANQFIPSNLISTAEGWAGIVIGSGTLAIAHVGLKIFGKK